MAKKRKNKPQHKINADKPSANPIQKINNQNLLNMAAQYMTALIQSGYGMTRAELTALDLIDMRPLIRQTTHTYDMPSEYHMFKSDHDVLAKKQEDRNFYQLIPCFSTGIYQINDDRYIYWSVKDIDADAESMKILITNYAEYRSVWCPENSVQFIIGKNTETGKIEAGLDSHSLYTTGDIALLYAMFDNQFMELTKQKHPEMNKAFAELNLGWTDAQKRLWCDQILKPATKAMREQADKNTHSSLFTLNIFLECTTLLNHYLRTDKPKTIRRNSPQAKQYIQKIVEEPNNSVVQSDRIIRLIGDIPVHSVDIPKAPTPVTVIHYKTPAWTTRGHIRRCKSGKVVYIKETVCHRKCLARSGTNSKKPQTIMKFKNEIAEKED